MALLLVVMDVLCSTPVWAPLNLGAGINYMHARSRIIPSLRAFTQTHAKPRDLTRTRGITRNIATCQIPTRDRASLSTRVYIYAIVIHPLPLLSLSPLNYMIAISRLSLHWPCGEAGACCHHEAAGSGLPAPLPHQPPYHAQQEADDRGSQGVHREPKQGQGKPMDGQVYLLHTYTYV